MTIPTGRIAWVYEQVLETMFDYPFGRHIVNS